MLETVGHNGAWPCYIRPIVLRGYGDAGVNPLNCPVEVYIMQLSVGKISGRRGRGLRCVRLVVDAAGSEHPARDGQGRRELHELAAHQDGSLANGYVEGIALDKNGFVSEGSGENMFLVHRDKLITAPLGNSVLPGITRDSVLQIARDLNIPIVEQMIPREMLYIADEAFFTGTAAEVTPIRSVDKIKVGNGTVGPITKALQKEFYAIVRGEKSDRHGWLTPVPVRSKQPVGV